MPAQSWTELTLNRRSTHVPEPSALRSPGRRYLCTRRAPPSPPGSSDGTVRPSAAALTAIRHPGRKPCSRDAVSERGAPSFPTGCSGGRDIEGTSQSSAPPLTQLGHAYALHCRPRSSSQGLLAMCCCPSGRAQRCLGCSSAPRLLPLCSPSAPSRNVPPSPAVPQLRTFPVLIMVRGAAFKAMSAEPEEMSVRVARPKIKVLLWDCSAPRGAKPLGRKIEVFFYVP